MTHVNRQQNRRQPKEVKQVNFRMGADKIQMLDQLCFANDRSRRVIVEILVEEAFNELRDDPDARISPL